MAQARDTLETAWLIAAGAASKALLQADGGRTERTPVETAPRRADEERLRIGRELHDSRASTPSLRTGRRDHPSVYRKKPKPFRYIDEDGGPPLRARGSS
ncbi:hypothetical protein D7Y56_00505 (plasmid) [Streptomyces sp. S501]|nr:hypothetical protein D7Y56_00505 [Streptomyces sp. S501]